MGKKGYNYADISIQRRDPRMKNVSLRKIFSVFFKIGTFSLGGVYSMLAFFENELVEKHKWLTHEEFIEGVAIGQMTPGAPIVNTGIYAGYKFRKIRGALAAISGLALTGPCSQLRSQFSSLKQKITFYCDRS